MEFDPVGMNFGLADKAIVESGAQFVISNVTRLGHMQNQFIQFERIVVPFAYLKLPRSHMLDVIQNVFELIKINESSLEFAEPQVADFGSTRDFTNQSRHISAAEWTWLVEKAT